MESSPKELIAYALPTGNIPFDEWIKGLKDRKGQAVILSRLRRFELTGHAGDHKPIGGGVLELRIPFGPGYRVYYGESNRAIVILLCGGDKRTQRRDIARAREYWNDYRSRS